MFHHIKSLRSIRLFIVLPIQRLIKTYFYPLYLGLKHHFYIGLPATFTIYENSKFKIHSTAIIDANAEIAIGFPSSIDASPKLILDQGVVIGQYCNIRATHGTIFIGAHTHIAQHVTFISSNHVITTHSSVDWDRHDLSKTGIILGSNCWIGANSVLLQVYLLVTIQLLVHAALLLNLFRHIKYGQEILLVLLRVLINVYDFGSSYYCLRYWWGCSCSHQTI